MEIGRIMIPDLVTISSSLVFPILIVTLAVLATTLLLFRKPRFLLDLLNSPPPLALLLLFGPLAIPSVVAELFVQKFKCTKKSPTFPPCDDALLRLPAHVLAQRIRDGELTSYSLTLRCIQRIKQANHYLNAIVVERFEDALEDAKAADLVLLGKTSKKTLPQLFGVPVVVKECFELQGLPFTSGIRARMGMLGEVDSVTMKRARRDGLIIVGTTNVSEGCMFHESNNPVYGLTRNPWDLARTAGGSSGGCAASVAAFFAPLAITSDVGGSTRLPAFYQGLFGHKPTSGTVPNTGTMPRVKSDSFISKYCQLGPTGRSSYDLFPLLKTLAGKDGVDQMVRCDVGSLRTTDPKTVRIDETLTVYNVREPFMSSFLRCGLHPECREAQRVMVEALREIHGVRVVELDLSKDFSEFRDSFAIWAAMMQQAQRGVGFGEIIHNNDTGSLLWCMLTEMCTMSLLRNKRHTHPALGLALLDKLTNVLPDANSEFRRKGVSLKKKLDLLLGEGVGGSSVMICPSVLCPAPLHHENMLRFTSTSQTAIFNVMELPTTVRNFSLFFSILFILLTALTLVTVFNIVYFSLNIFRPCPTTAFRRMVFQWEFKLLVERIATT
jgi:fatty acid amide hydrolase 2